MRIRILLFFGLIVFLLLLIPVVGNILALAPGEQKQGVGVFTKVNESDYYFCYIESDGFLAGGYHENPIQEGTAFKLEWRIGFGQWQSYEGYSKGIIYPILPVRAGNFVILRFTITQKDIQEDVFYYWYLMMPMEGGAKMNEKVFTMLTKLDKTKKDLENNMKAVKCLLESSLATQNANFGIIGNSLDVAIIAVNSIDDCSELFRELDEEIRELNKKLNNKEQEIDFINKI